MEQGKITIATAHDDTSLATFLTEMSLTKSFLNTTEGITEAIKDCPM